MKTTRKPSNGEALSSAQKRFISEQVAREVEGRGRKWLEARKLPKPDDRFISLLERLINVAERGLSTPVPYAVSIPSPNKTSIPSPKKTASAKTKRARAAA
jgi:hypothetical protein